MNSGMALQGRLGGGTAEKIDLPVGKSLDHGPGEQNITQASSGMYNQ